MELLLRTNINKEDNALRAAHNVTGAAFSPLTMHAQDYQPACCTRGIITQDYRKENGQKKSSALAVQELQKMGLNLIKKNLPLL